MASGIYNRFFYNLALGNIDWDSDNIKCALLGDSYTYAATHAVWSTGDSLAPKNFECANGNGYTTGGSSLDNCAVSQDDTADWAKLDADDEVWSGADFSMKSLYTIFTVHEIAALIDSVVKSSEKFLNLIKF